MTTARNTKKNMVKFWKTYYGLPEKTLWDLAGTFEAESKPTGSAADFTKKLIDQGFTIIK